MKLNHYIQNLKYFIKQYLKIINNLIFNFRKFEFINLH